MTQSDLLDTLSIACRDYAYEHLKAVNRLQSEDEPCAMRVERHQHIADTLLNVARSATIAEEISADPALAKAINDVLHTHGYDNYEGVVLLKEKDA